MFGLGKDDKNQLEENMKEIKQMINRGSTEEDEQQEQIEKMQQEIGSGGEWEPSGEQDTGPELESESQGEASPDRQKPGFDQENERDQESFSESGDSQSMRNEDSNQGFEREQDEETRNLNEDIPEPPETRQLNVPEIDKGPLFIRRQKFRKARGMIQEMRYISQEIEDVINQLERGIEQDRETERDAKELLHRMEEDRNGVKDIISPKSD